MRKVTNRRLRFRVDPHGDELLEPGAEPVDHTESAVPRTGQLDGCLDQPSQ